MTKGIYCYYDNWSHAIVYIGKDSYIYRNQRHEDHYNPLLKGKQKINKTLQNNNFDRYTYHILEQGDFTRDELNEREKYWIKYFSPFFCFTKGGDGGSLPGNKNINFNPCIKIRKHKTKSCKQGFIWKATPFTPEGQKIISNVNLLECMRLVEEFIDSKRNIYKYKTFKVIGFVYGVDEINYRKDFFGANNSRFNPCIKIIQSPDKTFTQGYRWMAQPSTPKKQITISSVDLQKCIKKVQEFIDSKRNIYGYTHYEIEYRNI